MSQDGPMVQSEELIDELGKRRFRVDQHPDAQLTCMCLRRLSEALRVFKAVAATRKEEHLGLALADVTTASRCIY